MNRLEIFKNELNLIENMKIRELTEKCLLNAPNYFFTMPASTSGRYHPAYALGEGGLVRHTKAAVKIANDLIKLEMYSKIIDQKDEILAALILHDSVKKGLDESVTTGTTTKHPIYAADLVKTVAKKHELQEAFVWNIADLIETHMGEWNKDYKTRQPVLLKPNTIAQKFVHMCDYLASRKYLNVDL